MNTPEEIDAWLMAQTYAQLDAVILRATEIRDQKGTEELEEIKRRAAAIGAKVTGANAHRGRRRRTSKQQEAE